MWAPVWIQVRVRTGGKVNSPPVTVGVWVNSPVPEAAGSASVSVWSTRAKPRNSRSVPS